MKFDMGQAWNQATAMLSANRDLVLVVAGVFFFLPYLALMLMMPDIATQLPTDPGTDPQVVLDALRDLVSQLWLPLLVVSLLQAIGSLSLISLLRDSSRPTLGEALKLGLIAFVPYLAAQLLSSLAVGFGVALLVGGGAAIHPLLGVLMIFVALAGAVYVWTKFSLTMPVIGVERVYNPLAALARSWALTKGNSLRLFGFYFLIIVAGIVVITVIQLVFSLIFAVFGAQAQLIGDGAVSSLLNAAWAALMLAVLAAAHRQLASGPGDAG